METIFTAQELETIHAYHQPQYVLSALDWVLTPALLVGAAWWGTPRYHRWAQRLGPRLKSQLLSKLWGGPDWSTALVFALCYFGVFTALSFPVEFYFGFLRERAWGLATTSWRDYALDTLKHQTLSVLSISALTLGVFGLARRSLHWWWWVGLVAAALLALSSLADPWKATLYLEQAPLPSGALRDRLEHVLAGASVEYSDIFVVTTSTRSVRLQAAFAGAGPTRTILLTDTLIAAASEQEIVAAVAHEAGHVSEARWPGRVLAVLTLFALLAGIELLMRGAARRHWSGVTQRGDVRVLPLIVLAFDLSMCVAAPISAAATRERELEADRFAVSLTGEPSALASVLVRVARTNKEDPDPPRWFVLSGMTHPPLKERLAALQKNATPPPTTPTTEGTSEQHAPGVMR